MCVYVHKYVCVYMHVYKHVHVYMYVYIKIKCLIIKSSHINYLAENVFVLMLAIINKCFALQNDISYFASLVHMDYECLTYFSPVVITYAMHTFCVHACMYMLTYVYMAMCVHTCSVGCKLSSYKMT